MVVINEAIGHDAIIFIPGHKVPPGKYREVGGRGREVTVILDDDSRCFLPASLDGRVAEYIRLDSATSSTTCMSEKGS